MLESATGAMGEFSLAQPRKEWDVEFFYGDPRTVGNLEGIHWNLDVTLTKTSEAFSSLQKTVPSVAEIYGAHATTAS